MSWLLWVLAQTTHPPVGLAIHSTANFAESMSLKRKEMSMSCVRHRCVFCKQAQGVLWRRMFSMAAEFVLLVTAQTLALLVQGFPWRTFSPVSAARYVSSVPRPVRACDPVATPQDDFGSWSVYVGDRLLCRTSRWQRPHVVSLAWSFLLRARSLCGRDIDRICLQRMCI